MEARAGEVACEGANFEGIVVNGVRVDVGWQRARAARLDAAYLPH